MKYLISAFFMLSFQSFANVQLRDVGVVGLVSHDIFAWDHKREVNTENGRLDLSTIFDFEEGKRWKKGGNPKNSENSPVYSITMELVDFYKKELKTNDPATSRKNTVIYFHAMVKETFERLSGLEFPRTALNEDVTNTEQAALRGYHDILPGRVKLFNRPILKEIKLTSPIFAKLRLNEKELAQELKTFDGDYDYEYKNIKIPFTKVVLNLMEIDRKFIEKFSPYKQADMMAELKKVGEGKMSIKEVFFTHHVFELMEKAICPTNNEWMPQEIFCY